MDDYSRFIWVKFLRSKDETPEFVINFLKQIQVSLNKTIRYIRTDNGTEFVNQVMSKYYEGVGKFHQKSVLRTPQQNGVIERRNCTLVEAARTMLIFSKAPMFLWAEAVVIKHYGNELHGLEDAALLHSRYVLDLDLHHFLIPRLASALNVKNGDVTQRQMLRTSPHGSFGPSADELRRKTVTPVVIVDDYSTKIEESLNVTFDETHPPAKTSPLVDDDLDEEEAIREIEKKNLENNVEDETLEIDEVVNIKESRNHPLENVIGNLNQRTLRSQAQNQSNFYCFISTIEPKNVNEALGDESWIVAMQEELNQFIANDVWELVPQPKNMTVIGTKWVFRKS
ncbi:retrovirus-related pol polyprotein from transposon TNT 1-94 [Tanacetum coccineum]